MKYLDDYTAEFKFGSGLLSKAKTVAKDLAQTAKSKLAKGGSKLSASTTKTLRIADSSPRIAEKLAAKTEARLAASKAKLDAVPLSAGLSKQKGKGTYSVKKPQLVKSSQAATLEAKKARRSVENKMSINPFTGESSKTKPSKPRRLSSTYNPNQNPFSAPRERKRNSRIRVAA